MASSRFVKFAWGVLVYNLLVIAGGVAVRATGSGDGCGVFWPLCHGQVIPIGPSTATILEYTHRVTSGLAGLLVFAMLVWAFRVFGKGHIVRKAAIASSVFLIVSAFIGAKLVLFSLVGENDSAARAVVMSLHLVNTLLLVGSIAATAYWGSGNPVPRLKGQGPVAWALGLGLLGLVVLGMSGAIAALGATLFPTESLAQGLQRDFSPTAHFLERLRVLHPLIATSVSLYLILLVGLVRQFRPCEGVRVYGKWVVVLVAASMAIGIVNLLAKTPLSMQMVHLVIADLLWIAVVLMSGAALGVGVEHVENAETSRPVVDEVPEVLSGRALLKGYVTLTKPRVISLLLFTTLTAMVIAQQGWPDWGLFFVVAIGGYMAAGAANAINMVIDRDIDGTMKRTSTRPTVTRQIPSGHALLFGLVLAVGSFALLGVGANLLTATLALCGLVFYVIVYTLMLKRRTWQNIVIGGAAGAFPPMVGWAAVTNDLSPLAWLLFALIFVWTPVHFWALALLIKDDYAKAGVPMLPVVRGERVTVVQIAMYAVLTALVSILPLLTPQVGLFYLVSVAVLNILLFVRCLDLYRNTDRPRAVGLYKYSMLYLALLFLALAVDRSVVF
ncbi:MAG: heme o synthase [Fimbriimonadaceae bacterium]